MISYFSRTLVLFKLIPHTWGSDKVDMTAAARYCYLHLVVFVSHEQAARFLCLLYSH